MERIAYTTKKDPMEVRKLNLAPKHASFKDIIDSYRKDTNYDDRKAEIAQFNANNAWKKRGLKMAIMNYPMGLFGNYPVLISVYHGDGTVSITHGGIEMGQGINTKAVQVCAYALKVPMEKISVVGSSSFTSPNAMASAGSITSESVAFAITKACNILLDRLEPIRNEMKDPTWAELIEKAHQSSKYIVKLN
jgi:xanthine dehydrogenase/oxidase